MTAIMGSKKEKMFRRKHKTLYCMCSYPKLKANMNVGKHFPFDNFSAVYDVRRRIE